MEKSDLISLAEVSNEESDLLDFKQEFSPDKKAAFWAETVKDIVAFTNTRGGIIVFGVKDDGSPSGIDCSALLAFDTAAITDQVKKYTDVQFGDFSIVQVIRGGRDFPAIIIEASQVPLVFSKVGTYEVTDGKQAQKQRTAFSLGTIYFRHGSKSEPCNREDISNCIKRNLEKIRNEWLGNIRKVVEAEPGTTLVVTRTAINGGPVRITSDLSAPAVRLAKLSEDYPYRQSTVIRKVNETLKKASSINSHDIQAIKLSEGISHEQSPEFMYRPHETSSPQYTQDFIDFIIEKYRANPNYFGDCRENWKATKY